MVDKTMSFQFSQRVPRHILRGLVPTEDVALNVRGNHDVTGTLDDAGEVPFHPPDLFAHPRLFCDVVHQEQGMIHLPAPIHGDDAVVIDTDRNAGGAVGQLLPMQGDVSSQYIPYLLLHAHFREDDLGEDFL